MKAPICRLCHTAHWGLCPAAATQPSSTEKPPRKAPAVKAQPPAAPVSVAEVLAATLHPKPPKGSPKPKKGKPKKAKPKPAPKVPPALPAKRRPRGRPLQVEESQSYENTKPWKKLKISRRTFYRRLKRAAS